jgi:sphingosine kinase
MSWAIIADCDIESEFIRFLGVLRNDIWGAWRVINLRTYKAKFSYLPAKETHSNTIDTSISYECPNLSDEVPSDWVTIEDDFILFWASQVTHASHNIFQSPTSKLDDGLFRIWIVR